MIDHLKLWGTDIDAFLNKTLNANELWSVQSSGGPKSIIFTIELLIEMSSGGSRVLVVRNRAVEPLELWTSETNAFLNRILNGNELWGPPDLWRFEIDAFLNGLRNRNVPLSL